MRIVKRISTPRTLRRSLFFTVFLFAASTFDGYTQTPAFQEHASAPATPQSLLETADKVFEDMSRLTGLPIKGPLKKLVLSRAEIRKFLEENLDEEYTPDQILREEAELKAFGLVSEDFDLKKFLLAFYTEQAAGAYDPHRKTMFIADWPSEDLQRIVLAHELTHALQDQNFDLVRFMRAARDNDDAMAARQAVMEGHATAAMMQQMIGGVPLAALPSLQAIMAPIINQQFSEFPAFTSAPFFFRVQALFPYIQGMGFMQMALQRAGWEGLNSIFTDPPTTTKSIYEPDAYFEHRTFPNAQLPRPPALEHVSGLHVLAENSLGQLGYYSLLGQLVSEDAAKATAPAWTADRYLIYEDTSKSPAHYALVARARWSDSESALAFFRAYHSILTKKYPELVPDKRSTTDLFLGSAANGYTILLRNDDECRFAEGIPASQADAMLGWLKSL